jgi:RimJ/RimL family protein N-acetyltransferase
MVSGVPARRHILTSMRDRETARLVLRRWRAEDLDAYARMAADPEVMRFVGGVRSRDGAALDLARMEEHWERHGFGLWAAELRSSSEVIGFVGLSEPAFIPELIGSVEVGWRLERAFWGRGLATEGGRAALDAAFGELELEEVCSIIHPDNAASRRVAEKLGMDPDGTALHPDGTRLTLFRQFRPGAQLR